MNPENVNIQKKGDICKNSVVVGISSKRLIIQKNVNIQIKTGHFKKSMIVGISRKASSNSEKHYFSQKTTGHLKNEAAPPK